MTLRMVFNATDTPVRIDAEGHILGGGEWGTVESTDPPAKQAMRISALVEVDDELATSDVTKINPAFVRSQREHKVKKDKKDKIDKLPKEKVAEVAARLPEDDQPDDDALRAELEKAIINSDAEPRIPRPSRTSRKES